MSKFTKSKHFVICGWNGRGYDFLDKTENALDNYAKKANAHRNVVLINSVLKDTIENDEKLEREITTGKLHYIYGEPTEEKLLENANIHNARTVILLADDNSKYADEKTLLRAMAISKFCREKNNNQYDSIYIIAEVNTPRFKTSLLDNDVNEVICTGEIGNDIMVQSALNHGISSVLHNILQYNQRNEFYTMNLRNFASLRGFNFLTLFNKLKEYNILLLGIKAMYYDENGKEIIDPGEVEKRLQQDPRKPPRQVMINPTEENEKNYTTDKDDQLIVLARSGDVIEQLKD